MRTKELSNGKITGLEKLSFGIVNIGNIPIQTLLTGFLMIFYTDLAGLSPVAVATMFLVMRGPRWAGSAPTCSLGQSSAA